MQRQITRSHFGRNLFVSVHALCCEFQLAFPAMVRNNSRQEEIAEQLQTHAKHVRNKTLGRQPRGKSTPSAAASDVGNSHAPRTDVIHISDEWKLFDGNMPHRMPTYSIMPPGPAVDVLSESDAIAWP